MSTGHQPPKEPDPPKRTNALQSAFQKIYDERYKQGYRQGLKTARNFVLGGLTGLVRGDEIEIHMRAGLEVVLELINAELGKS